MRGWGWVEGCDADVAPLSTRVLLHAQLVTPPEKAIEQMVAAGAAVSVHPAEKMLRIDARHSQPIAGIAMMDVLQVEMRPVYIRLTQDVSQRYESGDVHLRSPSHGACVPPF